MEPILSSQDQQQEQIEWTWEENKVFENALAELDHDYHLFERIATRLQGKSHSQVEKHYKDLIEDVQMIESDVAPLANYKKDDNSSSTGAEKRDKYPRRKGIRWTPEEHELFLAGLEKYGKGDWWSISRFSVVTKTPVQVASHAQKYFIGLQKSQIKQRNATTSTNTANV